MIKLAQLCKLFVCFCLFLSLASLSFALDKPTHEKINETVAPQIDVFLKSIGFNNGVQEFIDNNKIIQWIMKGGIKEDEPMYTRSRNHFHDPLKPWDQAGFNSPIPFLSGESLAYWIRTQEYRRTTDRGGDWSWKKAREYYYAALSGNSMALNGYNVEDGWNSSTAISGKTNMNDAERKQFFAWTFRAVGQTMHLVQDASVPLHTRNDGHVIYNYEDYIDALRGSPRFEDATKFTNFLKKPIGFSGPIDTIASFIDTDRYNGSNPNVAVGSAIGLAEYSNANFFSEDTVFSSSYPYPAATSATVADYSIPDPRDKRRTVLRQYFKKTADGEVNGGDGYRLATVGILDNYILNYLPDRYFFRRLERQSLDEGVYDDYASLLLPRAVGYSAGLLNYFFRGTIDITLPNSGLYSYTDGLTGFKSIKLMAKNTTSNEEEMNNGSIELVVKYKRALEDPFQNKAVAKSDFQYIVVSESSGKITIPRDSSVELNFNLPDNGLPLWATDVYLQVVYHGKLGNEDGAVAVGFKDISEPTPIDDFNNMDRICINGQWYVTGSQDAYDALPANAKWWDIWPHDLTNEYTKISPVSQPSDASSDNYTFYKSLIEPGTLSRTYILSDYEFYYSGFGTMTAKDPSDNNTHTNTTKRGTVRGAGIKNQDDAYPLFYSFRGVNIWGLGGFITDGLTYPNFTDPNYIPCSWGALTQ